MRIMLVGDVMLGRFVNEALETKPPEYPWGNTLSILKHANLSICNLECVISDIGEPFPPEKVFHFRTDQKNTKTLLTADIGMVSLANNHTLDYGYDALLRMMKVLDDEAIEYAGVGLDSVEAAEPAICRVDAQKVGLIAFTDNEPDWEAKENRPGLFYVPIDEKDTRSKCLFERIQKTRDDVDILVVSAHWGPNWGYTPPKNHVAFAHRLIDAGADIVFGHSPHVFRGIEIYKTKPIFYSCGDFIDDYAVDEVERNDESFVFSVSIHEGNISSITLYPTIIRAFQAKTATGARAKAIAMKMQSLCRSLHTFPEWQDASQTLGITIQSSLPRRSRQRRDSPASR